MSDQNDAPRPTTVRYVRLGPDGELITTPAETDVLVVATQEGRPPAVITVVPFGSSTR